MFLALRDLRHAKGRFALIVVVVALMTLLVGFLTGLTGGLAMQNISALMKLDSDRVVFSVPQGEQTSFSASHVTEQQASAWESNLKEQGADGGSSVTPLGISSVLLEGPGVSQSVALMAAPAGADTSAPENGIVLGSTTADEMGVTKGETITVAGSKLEVANVIEDQFYSHRAVAWTNLDTWHAYLKDMHQPDAYASVLLVNSSTDIDAKAADSAAGTTSEGTYSSLLALESFKSEIGSLGMMIGMLVVIATLVIGVFFLVWSMQRQRDIAVLKAVGATTRWLAVDAMGQALLVLVIGAGVGISTTLGLGLLVDGTLPFEINTVSIVGPALAMVVAGVLGALVSLKQITSIDPNTALQASAA